MALGGQVLREMWAQKSKIPKNRIFVLIKKPQTTHNSSTSLQRKDTMSLHHLKPGIRSSQDTESTSVSPGQSDFRVLGWKCPLFGTHAACCIFVMAVHVDPDNVIVHLKESETLGKNQRLCCHSLSWGLFLWVLVCQALSDTLLQSWKFLVLLQINTN